MNCTIRLASPDDVPAMLEIYAPYVRETVITFENDVPEPDEFRQRYGKIIKKCPWFVCEMDGRITGYSYAHQYREREAYCWAAECSIYVDPGYHGRNIGKALYACLLETLKLQGFMTAVGVVTVPNEKSEGLHASFGFERVGLMKNIGYKAGAWRNVADFLLNLGDFPGSPRPPRAIWEVSDTPEFESILRRAAALIKNT
jgi:L-amino acid N-acyltransferase YncA